MSHRYYITQRKELLCHIVCDKIPSRFVTELAHKIKAIMPPARSACLICIPQLYNLSSSVSEMIIKNK